MATHAHNKRWAYRFGSGAGRAWRGYARFEKTAACWLVAQGAPMVVARALLWLAKLALLGALFYVAFWLALLLLLMVAAAWVASNGGLEGDEQQPEWRMGLSGYGLYRGDVRVDLGEPDDD